MIEININATITRLNYDDKFKETCNFTEEQIKLCNLLYGTVYRIKNGEFYTDALELYGTGNAFYSIFKVRNIENGYYCYHNDDVNDIYRNIIYTQRKNTLDSIVYDSQLKQFLQNTDTVQLDELIMHEKVIINDKEYIVEVAPYQILAINGSKFKDNSILPFMFHFDTFKLQHFIKKHKNFHVIFQFTILSSKTTIKSIACKIKERQEIRKYQIEKDKKNIITKAPLLTDDELIALFNDGKKDKGKKNKKNKNNDINVINSDTSEDNSLNDITDITDISDTTSSDEENIKETYIKEAYTIEFNNNKYFTEHSKHKVINYINDLYNTNTNFQNVMTEYDTIKILQALHYDYHKKENSLHFTGILKNYSQDKESRVYHFYVNDTGIYSITEINRII
jgi:hypothetical protein